MQIHPLSTGTVRVKRSFLFPGTGVRRQLDLFLPGPFSEELPIHCWAIEHEGRLTLVDTGETAAARNIPFARFDVRLRRSCRARSRGWACRSPTWTRSCSPIITATTSTASSMYAPPSACTPPSWTSSPSRSRA